ncbi:SCP-like protein [Dictyocaulus viviparus]|uniref:SCP-like protein n=1 Tax=Dictyocaulus viviparus TaxID=29172 RepID=A0A0D8Y6F7_DICVI|nr:SCP-like protein [Dictyocaulus viviparus]
MREIVTIILLTFFWLSQGYQQVKLPNCYDKTKMNDGLRADIVRNHNNGRLYIATDSRGGDKQFPLSVYPTAANMSLMGYDCDLENEAEKISKECKYIGPSFDNVGINSDIFPPPVTGLALFYAVRSWWDKHSLDFYDLTPTRENKTMIPFLQMINDRSNKIGCSYTLCDSSSHYPFVSFVCKYGDPLIQPGVPIYTKGRPCSLCENKCVGGGLCNYLGI